MKHGFLLLILGVGIFLIGLYLFLYQQQGKFLSRTNAWQVNLLYNSNVQAFQLQSITPTTQSISKHTTKESIYQIMLLDSAKTVLYKAPLYDSDFVKADKTNPFFDKEVYYINIFVPRLQNARSIQISSGNRAILIIQLPQQIVQRGVILEWLKAMIGSPQAYAASSFEASLDGPPTIKASDDGGMYIATAHGQNLQKIGIYWAHIDSFYDYDEDWHEINSIQCADTERKSCTVSAFYKPSPTEYGPLILIVRVWEKNGTQCMGHPKRSAPWTSGEGTAWQRCGGAQDFVQIYASPPNPSDFLPPDNGKGGKNQKKKPKIKPTPTPVLYNCVYDPRCDSSNVTSIQFCRLQCSPIH